MCHSSSEISYALMGGRIFRLVQSSVDNKSSQTTEQTGNQVVEAAEKNTMKISIVMKL